MKQILFTLGFYLLITPLQALADFNDVLPKKGPIDGDLPDGDITTHFVPRVIDIMITSAYTISVGFMLYAAFLYIYAHGDEGDLDKAKNIFIYSVVGFLIITVSYAIVQGVTNFNFVF